MVLITVSFFITFGLIPRPYLTVFFTVATKRQTPACVRDCHCFHSVTHVRTVSRAAHGMSFFLSGCGLTEGPLGPGSAECWKCISPGANSGIYSGLQMPDRPCHTNSPASHSVLASDAGSRVSVHWALITKWKDTPAYCNTTISAEHTT